MTTMAMGELEYEFEDELEDEYEFEEEYEDELEYEDEYEMEGASPVWRGAYILGEAETEAFFEDLAEYAVGGGGGRGGLGGVASNAARAALGSGPIGVPLAWIGAESEIGTYVDPKSGLTRLKPLVVMEHFGHAMAEAESESEAEAFLPFLAPLAMKALPAIAKWAAPRIGRAVRRVAPRLMRGATRVLRTLRRSPKTQPLVRVLPTIVRRTVADVARDVQRGRPTSPQRVARQLSGETRRMLASPQRCVRAYRRSAALDRRYHVTCHRGPCR
jgi:hypothetical protein